MYRPRSAVFYAVAAERLVMPFLLPGRAKVYEQYKTYGLACQSKRGKNMPYHFEDQEFDLQRMPGTTRSYTSHTPERVDLTVHTPDHLFCYDPKCTCRENKEAITLVNSWVEQGLMTQEEATNFISGRTF